MDAPDGQKGKRRLNHWVVAVFGSVLGFALSQLLTIYTFYESGKTTAKIEKIHLARELVKDFYAEDAKTFRTMRTAIESCQPLYSGFGKGGKFTNDEINTYLGFFDDIGFYYREGALDLPIINQQFGAYIIEANEYEEVRKYIRELQANAKQKAAFIHFQTLAEALEKIPDRKDLAEQSRSGCSK